MIVAIILLVVSAIALVGAGLLIWKYERYGWGVLSGISGLLLIPSSIVTLCSCNMWETTDKIKIVGAVPEWMCLANFGFFALCFLMLCAAICMVTLICAVFAAIGNAL